MMLGAVSNTPATTPATVPAPGFSDGLMIWRSPSSGLKAVGTVFQNFSQAFAGTNLPVTLGILTPPVAAVSLLFFMGRKGK